MTVTAENRSTFNNGESDHTHDEELRGFDFHAPVVRLGDKALQQVQLDAPTQLTPEERAEPHELYGFAD